MPGRAVFAGWLENDRERMCNAIRTTFRVVARSVDSRESWRIGARTPLPIPSNGIGPDSEDDIDEGAPLVSSLVHVLTRLSRTINVRLPGSSVLRSVFDGLST